MPLTRDNATGRKLREPAGSPSEQTLHHRTVDSIRTSTQQRVAVLRRFPARWPAGLARRNHAFDVYVPNKRLVRIGIHNSDYLIYLGASFRFCWLQFASWKSVVDVPNNRGEAIRSKWPIYIWPRRVHRNAYFPRRGFFPGKNIRGVSLATPKNLRRTRKLRRTEICVDAPILAVNISPFLFLQPLADRLGSPQPTAYS